MSDSRRKMMGTTKTLPAWPDSEIAIQYNGEGKYLPYFFNYPSTTGSYSRTLTVYKDYVCGAKKICIYVPAGKSFYISIYFKDNHSYTLCRPANNLFSYNIDKEEYSTFSTNNYYDGYYYGTRYIYPEYTCKYVIPLLESAIEALNDYEGGALYMYIYFDYFSPSDNNLVGFSMLK